MIYQSKVVSAEHGEVLGIMINICAISWAEITTKKPGSIFTLPESSDAKFQLLLIQILSIYIYAGADSDFCGLAQPAIKSSQRLKDFALRPGGRSTHEDTLPEQALMRSDAKSSEWFCSFKFYLYNLTYYILSYTSIPCFRSESLSSLRMCPYHHMEEICVLKSMTVPLNLLHLVPRAADP